MFPPPSANGWIMNGMEIEPGSQFTGEIEEGEPVQQPVMADGPASPRDRVTLMWQPAVEAIETPRLESKNQQLPFGLQHSFGFAQQLVLVRTQLQCMRHNQQIHTFGLQGKAVEVSDDCG